MKVLACILMASKWDELDDRIPLIKEVKRKADDTFSYEEIL